MGSQTLRRALVGGLGSLLACTLIRAQGESLVDRSLVKALFTIEAAIADGDDAAAGRQAIAATQDYLDALGRSGEREGNECVVRGLEAAGGQAGGFTNELLDKMLREVQVQRSRGRPQRMLPALLVLFDRYPDDARVLYAMGEAYGLATPVFDADKSRGAFEKLLEVIREDSELRALSDFLPEMLATSALSEEQQVDEALWLRRHVIGYCDQLRSGKAIGMWRLADPRLDSLYEELVLARRSLDQKRCLELVEAMIAIQPVNPVLRHAAAEIYCSYGPAFNKKKAVAQLDEFLRMTDPSVLGGPDDRRSSVMGRPEIARDLRRFQLAQPRDDLEELRVAARALRSGMRERKVVKRLLAPDMKDVKRLLKSRSSYLERKERALGGLEESIAKNERNLRKVMGKPKEREFRVAIARQRKQLDRDRANLVPLQEVVDRLKELYERAR